MNQKYVFSFLCTVASYHCCHRMVHSFTCAGVLQTQYEKLSSFAGLGTLRNCYVRQGIHIRFCLHLQCMYKSFCTVYHQRSYMDLVSEAAEASMKAAVEEVHSLPHYASEGEVIKKFPVHTQSLSLPQQWVITDARHDSTANAYHTTVPCLSGRYSCPKCTQHNAMSVVQHSQDSGNLHYFQN